MDNTKRLGSVESKAPERLNNVEDGGRGQKSLPSYGVMMKC